MSYSFDSETNNSNDGGGITLNNVSGDRSFIADFFRDDPVYPPGMPQTPPYLVPTIDGTPTGRVVHSSFGGGASPQLMMVGGFAVVLALALIATKKR